MELSAFNDRESASIAAAQRLTRGLSEQLAGNEHAWLAVSGGTTPKDCFTFLSKTRIPWSRVNVTLTDERCVPADHADRNERMLRSCLMQEEAAQATFVPLDDLPQTPFAAVLLGMGTDGHFASLFPDADNLMQGLDPNGLESTLSISTDASPYGRVSLTLSRLLNSSGLTLLVFGADKREIIEASRTSVSTDLPISYVLNQNVVPVHVLWAP